MLCALERFDAKFLFEGIKMPKKHQKSPFCENHLLKGLKRSAIPQEHSQQCLQDDFIDDFQHLE